MKDCLGIEFINSQVQYPIGGTVVTIHGSNGPVQGTMSGGTPIPNPK